MEIREDYDEEDEDDEEEDEEQDLNERSREEEQQVIVTFFILNLILTVWSRIRKILCRLRKGLISRHGQELV